MTTEELVERLESQNELLSIFAIKEIYLFGSYGQEEATPQSDVIR